MRNNMGNRMMGAKYHAGRGISLIEVIAATVILGTAVTVLLAMQAASLERMHSIDNELLAVELAHELFADWRLNPTDRSGENGGDVKHHDGWSWRRQLEKVTVAPGVAAELVTLTVRHSGGMVQRNAFEREFQWLEHELDND